MESLYLLLSLLAVANAQIGSSSKDPCVTPLGEQGTCIPSPDCPQYQSHIQEGKDDPVSKEFLKQRICKLDLPNVYLCCPVESKSTNLVIPSEDECGIPSGLSNNQPGAWPWLAVIGQIHIIKGFKPICAGALITHRHILSVASCFGHLIDNVVVRLGEYNLDNDDAGERPEDYQILLFSRDHFNSTTYENDIILLPLDREVIFTDKIRPVCLPFPFQKEEFIGQRLTIAGWGSTDFAADGSKVPVAGTVPVVDRETCRAAYSHLNGRNLNILDSQMCAGDDRADACQGDAGAPLMHYDPQKDRFYVVGTVSFGVGCANAKFPGGYTRIASFLSWIKRQLNISE